jgi:hypothetical protein
MAPKEEESNNTMIFVCIALVVGYYLYDKDKKEKEAKAAAELAAKKVDCVMNEWGSWGTCSSAGKQSRKRTVKTAASGGGTACPDQLSEEQSCTYTPATTPPLNQGGSLDVGNQGAGASIQQTTPSAVNCVGDFEGWGACSPDGNRSRKYVIKTPASGGGIACQYENNFIQKELNLTACPVAVMVKSFKIYQTDATKPLNLAEIEVLDANGQLINMNENASVTSSSTLASYGANLLLDGVMGNFAHTNDGDAKPTFTITFKQPKVVSRIDIYNRNSNQDRASSAILEVNFTNGVNAAIGLGKSAQRYIINISSNGTLSIQHEGVITAPPPPPPTAGRTIGKFYGAGKMEGPYLDLKLTSYKKTVYATDDASFNAANMDKNIGKYIRLWLSPSGQVVGIGYESTWALPNGFTNIEQLNGNYQQTPFYELTSSGTRKYKLLLQVFNTSSPPTTVTTSYAYDSAGSFSGRLWDLTFDVTQGS